MPKTARAVVIGALGTAAIVAPAHAQTIEFPQTTSLFYGGFCWGNIRTWADTGPDLPGRAVLNVQALPVTGVGPGDYPLAPLCEVDTTVSWRNMTSGAAGEYRVNVVAGLYGSILYAMLQDTGPGHIEVVVTTNGPHLPVRGSFDVPAPPPPPPGQ
ncbi:hypothetical protein NDR87_26730 [Nocardia sp. CDC159]|uniref:Carboxypeptidase regulatory-like domain-containing protein n=1 Tax=Nocardia pulmonis TaxID=2951408 RepID=A0A9X2EF50_9NOCA|nr:MULTISPECIES: hypothetical protein [Nocardia]MCM6777088.1 hypothetical protein [Nocardia pulmonis]MCM6789973.1 hypothetical protein [Nocardia sp. CDC159]